MTTMLDAGVGVPAAIVAGKPMSTVVLGVAILIGLPALTWWYFRRSNRNRLAMSATAVIAVVLVAAFGVTLSIPRLRGYVIQDLAGFQRPERIELVQGTVPRVKSQQGKEYDRFRLVISNPTDTDQLATKFRISQSYERHSACNSNVPYRYRIDGVVVLVGTQYLLDGDVRQLMGSDLDIHASTEDVVLPFDGSARGMTCGEHYLWIAFEVTIVLEGKTLTTVEVDVPADLFSAPYIRIDISNTAPVTLDCEQDATGQMRCQPD